jgi:hypothetical protein
MIKKKEFYLPDELNKSVFHRDKIMIHVLKNAPKYLSDSLVHNMKSMETVAAIQNSSDVLFHYALTSPRLSSVQFP